MMSHRVDNAISVVERTDPIPTGIVRDLSVQLRLFENTGSSCASDQTIGRLVMRSTATLRPHPEIAKRGLEPRKERILELEKLGESVFEEPLLITQDNVIIGGHARWLIASRQKRETVLCFAVQLTQQEALQRMLETHSRKEWLHPLSRVELARTLRPGFREISRANQIAGGANKASSNLTEDKRVECRAKLAAIAKVSEGTFTYAEQILDSACSLELLQALRSNEVKIHFAWKLRNSSSRDQHDALVKKRAKKRERSQLSILNTLSKKAKRGPRDACLERLKLVIEWMKELEYSSEIKKRMGDLLVAIEFEKRQDRGMSR